VSCIGRGDLYTVVDGRVEMNQQIGTPGGAVLVPSCRHLLLDRALKVVQERGVAIEPWVAHGEDIGIAPFKGAVPREVQARVHV
jgi:hypothetical protein